MRNIFQIVPCVYVLMESVPSLSRNRETTTRIFSFISRTREWKHVPCETVCDQILCTVSRVLSCHLLFLSPIEGDLVQFDIEGFLEIVHFLHQRCQSVSSQETISHHCKQETCALHGCELCNTCTHWNYLCFSVNQEGQESCVRVQAPRNHTRTRIWNFS